MQLLSVSESPGNAEMYRKSALVLSQDLVQAGSSISFFCMPELALLSLWMGSGSLCSSTPVSARPSSARLGVAELVVGVLSRCLCHSASVGRRLVGFSVWELAIPLQLTN